MELIPKDSIFEFHHDTLQYLKKQYDLDKQGRIEEAIDLLESWIKKQNHFLVKTFPRDYLERTIIISKGSVERAKKKLDSICAYRTSSPDFFTFCDAKKSPLFNDLYGVFLPKLMKDHYRVYLLKNRGKSFSTGFLDFYRFFFMQCEYIQAHDYCNGIVLVLDYTETNIMETVKWFNLVDLREALMITKDAYGMRVKGMHIISGSKAIDAVVTIFKQAISAKLGSRLIVHKTIDTVYNFIDKDIFPVEYGGTEKTLLELHENLKNVLTSDDFVAYLNEMSKARTDESLRLRDKDADRDMGIPGSFRSLNVD